VAGTSSYGEGSTPKPKRNLERRAYKEDAFTSFVVENIALRVGGRQLRHSSVHEKLYQYNEREFLKMFGQDSTDRALSSKRTSTSGESAEQGAQLVKDQNPEAPVKRKRGRPRKIKNDASSTTAADRSNGGTVQESGKRGRKKGHVRQSSTTVGVVPVGSGTLGCAPGLEERRKARRNRRRRELEAVIGVAAGIEVEQAAKLLAEEEDTLTERAREQSIRQRVSTSGHVDTTSFYLKAAAEEPLLTHAEEVELAYRVRELVRIVEAKQAMLEEGSDKDMDQLLCELGIPSMDELNRRMLLGKIAKERMIRANMRLVVACAKRYQNQGLQPLDLWQEGNLGLIKGVERFDPDKGFRVSTYVYWWIRQAITRAIAYQGRTIRLPMRTIDALYKLNEEIRRYMDTHNFEEPSEEELATLTGMSVSRVQTVLLASYPVISLDGSVQETGGSGQRASACSPNSQGGEAAFAKWSSSLANVKDVRETLSDPRRHLREGLGEDLARIEETLTQEAVQHTLKQTLGDREVQVLRMRYGLAGEPVCTPADMGKLLGLSRERVRQIEKGAIKKLMQDDKTDSLREYLWMYL